MSAKLHVTVLFHLEPAVDGGLGEGTIIRSLPDSRNPVVEKLEYVFEDWSGDELVTSFPCYLVSATVWKMLTAANLTGLAKKDVVVSRSEQLDGHLPQFVWLTPTGRLDEIPRYLVPSRYASAPIWSGHEVCLGPKAELILSSSALNALELERVKSCKIRPIACWNPANNE